MARASLLELSLKLAILQHKIGSLWRHKSGDLYQITVSSIQEKDGDPALHYRPIIGRGFRSRRRLHPARLGMVRAELHPAEGGRQWSRTLT
jgi:hypothetical protein